MAKRYVYLNYAQQESYYAYSRRMICVFARRTGKTHGMLGPYMHRAQKSMPRGHGAFLGCSRKQLMAKTLPAVCMSWNATFGLKEGENFVIGKPPAKLNYPDPIYKPKDWSNTLSFANGYYWSLVSLAQTAALNGETVSSICGDEGKFYPPDKLNEVYQANSGVIDPWGNEYHSMFNPFYRSLCIVSDASLSSKGSWMEKEESKMDIKCDSGPNEGRTSREMQAELLEHARKICDFNDACYFAKKAGRSVIVVSQERYDYAKALRQMCQNREGKFHILPNGENSKRNCDMLVEYKVLSPADAELLFCADFLITEELDLYRRMCERNPKYKDYLRQLRCDTFNYFSGSTIDNLSLLGESYIKDMYATLSPMVFAISVLGIKLKQSSSGFYFALDIDGKHGYVDTNETSIVEDNIVTKKVSREYNGKTYTAEMDTVDYDRLSNINDCRMDGDLLPNDELMIAFDYNSRINWLVVGAMHRDPGSAREHLAVLNSMYVKLPDFLETLMDNFNRYYAPHRRRNRNITFFYDSTALYGGNYASKDQKDNKDIIIEKLRQAGWNVRVVYMGKQMAHAQKYKEINNGLAGLSFPGVKINKEKNEALIVSLENAGVKQGYNGFEKDKSGEKLAYNPDLDSAISVINGHTQIIGKANIPEEFRTDGSDAFDTLYLGVKHFRYSSAGVFACG